MALAKRPREPSWWASVTVCGFTFRFRSRERLVEAIAFYSRKTHPSSRLPSVDGMWNYPAYGDHEEAQRWFERVPLKLQREGKRQKVLAALKGALGTDAPASQPAPKAARRAPATSIRKKKLR